MPKFRSSALFPVASALFALAASSGFASEAGHAEHGLSPNAPVLFHLGPLPVNNSMFVSWLVAGVIILVARIATQDVKAVPTGIQNLVEWIVESLRNFLEGIIGRDLTAKTFWFFATAFVFILTTNWVGLVPGVGTVGWGVPNEHGQLEHISRPLFRGANADVNLTFAMAVIFMGAWLYWSLKANGPVGFLKHLFAPRGDSKGLMKVVMIVVFLAAGILEVVSIAFRPISLSFRLYGNIFAGETMLENMAGLVKQLAWLIPVPFYFMELIVGFAQALVFMLLTAVFTFLMCDHGGEHGESHH